MAIQGKTVDQYCRRFIKRVMDVAVSLVALIVLAPLLLVVAIMIKIVDPGPVLFRHKRLGRNGRPFYCLKFRTMIVDAEDHLENYLEAHPEARKEWVDKQKLMDDPRVTPLGKILRKTSVDEFPQLVNIIIGDMSLVGPRPNTEEEVVIYGQRLSRCLSVRPGLTGL